MKTMEEIRADYDERHAKKEVPSSPDKVKTLNTMEEIRADYDARHKRKEVEKEPIKFDYKKFKEQTKNTTDIPDSSPTKPSQNIVLPKGVTPMRKQKEDDTYDKKFEYRPTEKGISKDDYEFPMLNAAQLKALSPEQKEAYQGALKQYITAISPKTSNFKEELDKKKATEVGGPPTTPQTIKQLD